MENQNSSSTETANLENEKPKSGFSAFVSKWACAFPTVAAVFAVITERAFFGQDSIWEMLRGTNP